MLFNKTNQTNETNQINQLRRGDTGVTHQPDAELDLRGVICPYNFVKTKLKLEAMEQGQVLSVLLDDGDPIGNVPRSVSNEGHTILSIQVCLLPSRLRAPVSRGVSAVSSRILVNNAGYTLQ
ncbi:MAG: sulfurtransferase TusA family protein [Nitrospira sp.]|nr:MAG: sulfurtransferase TusA family protein [Nitrospira sp.]